MKLILIKIYILITFKQFTLYILLIYFILKLIKYNIFI